MSLELIIAGVLMTTLTGYVLTGVADFGAGAWYLAARGGRAPAQRAFIDRALAPIWEANHVWLIVVLVLLFAGFPSVQSCSYICRKWTSQLVQPMIYLFNYVFHFR